MDSPHARLSQGLEALGISLPKETQDQLLAYQDQLLETNKRLNLTSIKDPLQAVVKHLLDSLASLALPALEPAGPESWMDLGSGGGLPGMPVAIARPELTLHLLESTKKKANFLLEVGQKLGISEQIRVLPQRAEEAARGPLRGQIEVCLARGLGHLRVISELALPFLQLGGVLIAYKGPKADQELDEAKRALRLLHGELVDRKDFALPFLDEKRSLLVIKKVAESSGDYPRANGIPAKEPL